MTALKKLRKVFNSLCRITEDRLVFELTSDKDLLTLHLLKIESALKAVEDEQRWVPVEERLPEESEDDEGYPRLLVVDSKGHVAPAIFHAETQCFEVYRILGKENAYLRLIAGAYDFVTHWRPLPEGPEETQK